MVNENSLPIVYISLDIGIKNLGIFIADEFCNPIYIENGCLFPYTLDKFVEKMELLIEIALTKNNLLEKRNYNNISIIVIMEKQLPINREASKVMHHAECFFHMKGIPYKLISSKDKGISQNKYNKYNRKKDSIKLAEEFLSNTNLIESFSNLKKKDDVADAICQLKYFIFNGEK